MLLGKRMTNQPLFSLPDLADDISARQRESRETHKDHGHRVPGAEISKKFFLDQEMEISRRYIALILIAELGGMPLASRMGEEPSAIPSQNCFSILFPYITRWLPFPRVTVLALSYLALSPLVALLCSQLFTCLAINS
jgi:hypothetical protein